MKTIIVGTGAAGFCAADWLYSLGETNIKIITKGINKGTSRNTGSDKQTYYKLSLAGNDGDSVGEMAQTLFEGGSVNGDTALCEAACSVKSFMKLANLGMPFPTNAYGEYVGYKTDHDPRQRATSCGPLTSKLMTETLEKSVKSHGIEICDNVQLINILTTSGKVYAIKVLDIKNNKYKTIYCDNVILATGAPATIYKQSVYPHSQSGALGVAIKAGARLANLNQWQYGLASTKFRWNVSGTYQQVLPRYISVDKDGNENEFLLNYYEKAENALDMVFLKGYQWPFDFKKLNASSQIDILVNKEIQNGNRVYMDFRENPTGLDFEKLSNETYDYLKNSSALLGKPIERLAKMNPKAIKLYKDNGIDLYSEALEVAVCAQHINGGIEVDANWETNIKGLYAIGEAAGTFGICRPGGSALNSTQVGALRASEHITYKKSPTEDIGEDLVEDISNIHFENYTNLVETRREYQEKMSKHAAFIRNIDAMKKLQKELIFLKDNYTASVKIASKAEISGFYQFYDDVTADISILSAMIFSAENSGSLGSAYVLDSEKSDYKEDKILVTENEKSFYVNVRPIPKRDNWFEKVWAEFDERRGK